LLQKLRPQARIVIVLAEFFAVDALAFRTLLGRDLSWPLFVQLRRTIVMGTI